MNDEWGKAENMTTARIGDVEFNLGAGSYSNDQTLTVAQASRLTGLSRDMIEKLIEGGFFPDMSAWRFVELSKREVILSATGNQPVLRTSSTLEYDVEDNNRVVGCRADMTPDVLVEATRKYWRCNPHRIIDSGFLPVSVGAVSVAALRISGLDGEPLHETGTNANGSEYSYDRYAFEAELIARLPEIGGEIEYFVTPTDIEREKCELMFGAIQGSVSGGPIAYL